MHRCHTQDLDNLNDDQADDDTVLVVGHWLYAGQGHTPGQAPYAQTIAEDIAENRRLARLIGSADYWEET